MDSCNSLFCCIPSFEYVKLLGCMRRFFAYSSKITLGLPINGEDIVEKMLIALKKKLSEYSWEDADLINNTVYFAVNIRSNFPGIDSGMVNIEEKDGQIITRYWLSFISPFFPFLLLDVFLFGLSYIVPSHPFISVFALIIAFLLGVNLLFTVLTITSFSGVIQEVWFSVQK